MTEKEIRDKIEQEVRAEYFAKHDNFFRQKVFTQEDGYPILLNKLIEAYKQIENEQSENERLVRDGKYLTQQINNLQEKEIIYEFAKEIDMLLRKYGFASFGLVLDINDLLKQYGVEKAL